MNENNSKDSQDSQEPERKIIRHEEIRKMLGVSRSTLYRYIKYGRFVAPIQLSQNSSGWYYKDVEEWFKSSPRVKYAPQNKD